MASLRVPSVLSNQRRNTASFCGAGGSIDRRTFAIARQLWWMLWHFPTHAVGFVVVLALLCLINNSSARQFSFHDSQRHNLNDSQLGIILMRIPLQSIMPDVRHNRHNSSFGNNCPEIFQPKQMIHLDLNRFDGPENYHQKMSTSCICSPQDSVDNLTIKPSVLLFSPNAQAR
jgi:hypothetical protein